MGQPFRTLAIWDFDGTIIEGDSSEGLVRQGKTCYPGLIADCINAGFSLTHRGAEGVRRFFAFYNEKLRRGEIASAYRDVASLFVGARASEMLDFCIGRYREMCKFFFRESIAKLKHLAMEGVENHIVSASLDVFVRAALKTLGVVDCWIHGVQVATENGCFTNEVLEPFPCGDGKIAIMRLLEKERNGNAMYGFGNSYKSDGPFLLEIAKQGGHATMINGGAVRVGMSEYFDCIVQTETMEG